MLGVESQYKLKDFFQTVAEQELSVERQRQGLASIPDFEPYAAFTRFDRNANNKVNDLEIYQFLRYYHEKIQVFNFYSIEITESAMLP